MKKPKKNYFDIDSSLLWEGNSKLWANNIGILVAEVIKSALGTLYTEQMKGQFWFIKFIDNKNNKIAI